MLHHVIRWNVRKATGRHAAPAEYGRRAAGHIRPFDTRHPYSLRTERLIFAGGTDHVKRPHERCTAGDSALRFHSCCGDNRRHGICCLTHCGDPLNDALDELGLADSRVRIKHAAAMLTGR